jgi:hypothetical protein
VLVCGCCWYKMILDTGYWILDAGKSGDRGSMFEVRGTSGFVRTETRDWRPVRARLEIRALCIEHWERH